MNCQEALSLLYEIIDKEASEIDERAVREHIEHCRHCREIYRVESRINDFVVAKVQEGASVERLESLKFKILEELDLLDSAPTRRGFSPFFRRLVVPLAAVACLALVVGVVYLASNSADIEEHMVPLEQAHRNAADSIQIYQNAAYTSMTTDYVGNDLHYALSSAIQGFTLVGGRIETILNVDVGHFVYRDGRRLVSVFLAPAEKLAIPDGLLKNAIVRDHMGFYNHVCHNCRFVFHKSGDVLVITASTDKDVELLDFIPGHSVI